MGLILPVLLHCRFILKALKCRRVGRAGHSDFILLAKWKKQNLLFLQFSMKIKELAGFAGVSNAVDNLYYSSIHLLRSFINAENKG